MAGNKEFGKHIQRLREAKGYSQEKLAELVANEPAVPNNQTEHQIITDVIKKNATEITAPKQTVKTYPTLPRKVDKQIFEGRLKEYRLQKAQEEHKSPAYIFENKALYELSEARNRILLKQDLYDIKYWAEYRINKYGDDIIDILNQLDQNYIQ